MNKTIGILITNIGSPDSPTPKSVRHYLKKFLSDPRVVKISKWLWYPILYAFILPFRSIKSAKLYQQIWTEHGSPLSYISHKLQITLQNQLKLPVALGMHYGNPSIEEALTSFKKQVDKIIIFPLYPQYSETTTAASFDMVAKTLKKWNVIPEVVMLHDYAIHPAYIQAISDSIKKSWEKKLKPDFLLFSFHSIPKQLADQGDPYPERCKQTAKLIAQQLELSEKEWSVAFQSRLGRAEWLQPYTDKVLTELPKQGIKNLHVVCPGFAVDCLETLEEINIRGKEQFLNAGGKEFFYIPALNDSDEHVKMLIDICRMD